MRFGGGCVDGMKGWEVNVRMELGGGGVGHGCWVEIWIDSGVG